MGWSIHCDNCGIMHGLLHKDEKFPRGWRESFSDGIYCNKKQCQKARKADSTAAVPNCPQCHGTGIIRLRKPATDT